MASASFERGPQSVQTAQREHINEGSLVRILFAPRPGMIGEHWTKPVPPEPDGLVADVDPALGQQILDITQRQWYRTDLPLNFHPTALRASAGLRRGARVEQRAIG